MMLTNIDISKHISGLVYIVLCVLLFAIPSSGVHRSFGHCYKLSNPGQLYSWHVAKDACAALGLKMATIESAEEWSFLVDLIRNSGS